MDASGGGGGHRGGGQSRASKKRAKKRRANEDRKRRLEQQQRQEEEEKDQDNQDRVLRKRRHPGDHTEEEGGTATKSTPARGPDPDESSHRRRRRKKNGEGGGNTGLLSDGGEDGSSSASSSTSIDGARAISTSAPPTLAEIIRSIVATNVGEEGEGKGKGGGEAKDNEDEAEDDEEDLSPSDLTAEERGRLILRSILHPAVTVEEFYDTYWEKLPLHVSAAASSSPSHPSGANGGTSSKNNLDVGKRTAEGGPTTVHGRRRLDGLLSLGDIEEMISSKCLRYKYDLNVTRCDESTGMRRVNFDHNGEDKVGTTTKGGRKVAAAAPCVDKYDKDEAADEEGTDGGIGDDISSSPPEIVDPDVIWPRFKEAGCTIRMLCPQKHADKLHAVLSTLESEFGCMVGCNAYLTPGRASRGFAPHYDDIEAFVLQVEGRKRWRVYRPINGGETLPRVSSDDFVMVPATHESDSDDNDAGGLVAGLTRSRRHHDKDGRRRVVDEPVLDVTLGPGDVLYMPRGWIHHAVTPDDERGHSLHLTVSCMQNWAWADLMELIVPEALASAVQDENSTRLREGLPRNFLAYMGAVHDTADGEDIEGLRQAEDLQSNGDNDGARREKRGRDSSTRSERKKEKLRRKFKEEAKKCIDHICREAISMLDAGCDQIGKRFLSDRLPPALTGRERSTTNEASSASAGTGGIRLMPDTMCRLVRDGIARLVLEDGRAVLYHCADNSREFHGNPLSPMEFEMDDAPAIEQLLTTSAKEWIRVRDLTHDEIEDKIGIAQALFDEGILSIYQPTS